MANTYAETDATTIKPRRRWLAVGDNITESAPYNIVLAQQALPNWRRVGAPGPFEAGAATSPEKFAERLHDAYPGQKAAVPPHLQQGVLGLPGKGKAAESAGHCTHDLAANIPAAWERTRQGQAFGDLRADLGLPPFRTLLGVCPLPIANPYTVSF